MALPTSGPLSLFAIFKEIYGREPNIGERVSFHNLVQASNLANKSFPCPFSRFYGYTHAPQPPLKDNKIHLSILKINDRDWRVNAAAQYPVASKIVIDGSYYNDFSGSDHGFSLTIQANDSIGKAVITTNQFSDTMVFQWAQCSPPNDSVYNYIAEG